MVGQLTPVGGSNLFIYLFLLFLKILVTWWLQGLKTLFYVVGADPSRERVNILEFETFSEIFGWLGGLRIPFSC